VLADPPAALRRLIDRGSYPAAESLALALLTRPSGVPTDSAGVADLLDLMVEAMVAGGRWWEPRADAAMARSLAIRALEPGRDSLDLARSLVALGGLRVARWDHRGAAEAFVRSAGLRERALGPDHPELIAPLGRAALALHDLGDARGTDSLLERSAAIADRALAPDHPGRIESDFARALVASDRESADTTLFASVIERTERVFGAGHPRVAARLKPYASVHRAAARYARAHELLTRAHAITRRALGAENLLTVQVSNAIGVNHVWSARADLAVPHFEEAFTTIRDASGSDHVEIIKPMMDLGDAYRRLGDAAEGLALLERAVEIADRELPEDHWLVPLVWLGLADGYLGAGRAVHARPILERVLAVYTRTRPGSWDQARVMDLLAQTGVGPTRARELLEGAARIYLDVYGPDHPKGGRGLGLLSRFRMEDGDTLGAIALRESSIVVATRTLGPHCTDASWGLLSLGQMYGACGRHEDAARCLERSVAAFTIGSGPEHPLTAMALRELAVWQAVSGRSREAFRTASQAEEIRRDHLFFNASAMPEDEALTLLRAYPMSQGAGVNVMLSLASGPLAGDLEARREAWDALIRSRAMVLDEMGARHRSWALGADPEVATLAARFDSAARRLAGLELRADEPRRHLGLLTDLHRARTDRNRAERALAARSASFRARGNRERMGLDSVVASLPDGAALVAYVRYERFEVRGGRVVAAPSYLACVLGSDDTPALVPLGTASDIDSLVALWRRDLEWEEVRRGGEPAAERRYRRVAARLRQAVWDPVAARIGRAPRAFLVPDGSLGLVNFATFPLEDSAYLLERGPAIHYLSAERDLALGNETPAFGVGLLAMGDPEFDALPESSGGPVPEGPMAANAFRGPRTACTAFGEVRFGPLPASGEEIGAVARLWRALPAPSGAPDARTTVVDSLTGASASERDLRARVSGHRVVHLATHGFFVQGECEGPVTGTRGIGGMIPAASGSPSPAAREHPLRLSGLALAGANLRARALPDQDDGILTAEEIAALDLTGVQWAVLSACETGVGEYRSGEGLMGLRRAFHIAGARTTITSLWRVRDRAVARWMGELYEGRWRRGLDTVGSVRAASLAELRARRAAGLATHPAHWGAFIAMGDWR
jgi:CHAT domain-containing protein/tetratricopeptide (TPR) repeat protein